MVDLRRAQEQESVAPSSSVSVSEGLACLAGKKSV